MMPRLLAQRPRVTQVAVLHRLLLGLGEEMGGLVQSAALERDGATHVQGPEFQRTVGEHARPRQRHHGPSVSHLQPTQPGMGDAAEHRERGRLLQFLGGVVAEIGEQIGVAAPIRELLSLVQRLQHPVQLRRELLLPVPAGQFAQLAFGTEPAEDGMRGPAGIPSLGVPIGATQDQRKVGGGLRHELQLLMRLRPDHDVSQRRLRLVQPPLGGLNGRHDPQCLGLLDRIRQPPQRLQGRLDVAPRPVQLAPRHEGLRPPADGLRHQRGIAHGRGLWRGQPRLLQRPVELALLAVGDAQIVPTLRDAPPEPGPLEGREGHLVGAQRLGLPAAQVADDAQVIAGAADGEQVAVAAPGEHRLGEVVRCLVDPAGYQRDPAQHVKRPLFDVAVAALAGLLQRQLHPLESVVGSAQPGLRRAIDQ